MEQLTTKKGPLQAPGTEEAVPGHVVDGIVVTSVPR
jgi:hypothetical protein